MVMPPVATTSQRAAILRSVAIATVLFSAGCGKPATVIEGLLSLDGQPVPNATLEFFPVSGKGGVSFTTSRPDGRYRVAVWPTPLKVIVTATKVDGKERDALAPDGPLVDRIVSALPERYGFQANTPLVAEPVEGKTTTIDFALESTK